MTIHPKSDNLSSYSHPIGVDVTEQTRLWYYYDQEFNEDKSYVVGYIFTDD